MSTSSSSSDKGSKVRILVAAAVAVGGLGAALLLLSRRFGGGGTAAGGAGSRVKDGALNYPVESDPHGATQATLNAIRSKKLTSVGHVVFFVRGPSEVVFPGEKLRNAYRVRAPAAFIQFLQESYLPATAAAAVGAGSAAGVLPIERPMMAQLTACDFTLRRLERERATPFDNDNRAHVNLLEQLWAASGKPLSMYARMGEQWTELGFQGDDPTTDIRGSGILGLRQFVSFAQRHPQAMKGMIEYNRRVKDEHGDSWYLIAVVSFQFTAQLMLQSSYPFHLNHLQVLYDSLVPTATLGGEVGSPMTSASGATAGAGSQPSSSPASLPKAISRSALVSEVAEKHHLTPSEASARVWLDGEYTSDAEAGLFLLHERLMLHFKANWEADKPDVMSYNTYVAEKVFTSFFTSAWTL